MKKLLCTLLTLTCLCAFAKETKGDKDVKAKEDTASSSDTVVDNATEGINKGAKATVKGLKKAWAATKKGVGKAADAVDDAVGGEGED